ncbi:26277_t:CDS:2, partial [Gigaspora margarita]
MDSDLWIVLVNNTETSTTRPENNKKGEIGIIFNIKIEDAKIKPYEPIVHGTFDNQPELSYMPEMVAIEIIKDFFAEIMTGGCGFRHKDHDGLPTHNPILPNLEVYDAEVWKKYNHDLLKEINQQKVNLNWVEVYSRYSQFLCLYKTIKNKKLNEKEINKLIRETIPNDENLYLRTSFWRKAYDNLCLIFE